jgi:hypothetical protein
MLFMMGDTSRLSSEFHYGIESSVGLFWALPAGIGILFRVFEGRHQKEKVSTAILIGLFICTTLGTRQNNIYRMRIAKKSVHEIWIAEQALPAVHTGLSLSAPTNLTPHLLNRAWIHHLPKLQEKGKGLVNCVIYDSTQDPWPMKEDEFRKFPETLTRLNYQKTYECRTFQVYQSPDSSEPCLIAKPVCPAV